MNLWPKVSSYRTFGHKFAKLLQVRRVGVGRAMAGQFWDQEGDLGPGTVAEQHQLAPKSHDRAQKQTLGAPRSARKEARELGGAACASGGGDTVTGAETSAKRVYQPPAGRAASSALFDDGPEQVHGFIRPPAKTMSSRLEAAAPTANDEALAAMS